METGGDDDSSMGGSTTDEPMSGSTSGTMPGSTGVDPSDGSSEGEGTSSTGMVDDEGSSGSTGSMDEGSSGSTGEDDESTGEAVLGIEELVPGDLVVTEVMWNPHCSGDSCEWIEILNTTGSTVNLLDLYIQDNDYNAGNQGRVTLDLFVASGEMAVIARGVGSWPYMFTADAVYGPNPGLNNGSPDRVVLRNSTEILDETAIFDLDGEQGDAWSLSGAFLDSTSNDDSGFWCPAVDGLPAGATTEYGSPHVLNPPC